MNFLLHTMSLQPSCTCSPSSSIHLSLVCWGCQRWTAETRQKFKHWDWFLIVMICIVGRLYFILFFSGQIFFHSRVMIKWLIKSSICGLFSAGSQICSVLNIFSVLSFIYNVMLVIHFIQRCDVIQAFTFCLSQDVTTDLCLCWRLQLP